MKLNVFGKVAKLFIERFELTVLLVLMLLATGALSYVFLPKESLPEIVFPSVTIQTVFLGAGPEDVEQLVSIPIENQMNAIDDVVSVTSVSGDGFSFVSVTFEEGADMVLKKSEVESALGTLTLPAGTQKPVASLFKTSEIPLISFALTGDFSLSELTEYAETLKKSILALPGVEAVNVFGGAEKEVKITLDKDQMRALGLTFDGIASAIRSSNISVPLGSIVSDEKRINLRLDERFTEIDALSALALFTPSGTQVALSDVAKIEETYKPFREENRSFIPEKGLNNSVFVSVIRANRSDVLGTSESVKKTVTNSLGTLLPDNMGIYVSRDTALQVRDDLNSIRSNAISGLLVVVLVLFVFIGFKEALIVAITIPLTLLSTLSILGLFGITLNTFAILGLIVALGLLVDNTIIVMENMDRLKKIGHPSKDAAVLGTDQVGFPIASATLTTVAAFFPLAILPGVVGAFINTIPRTIIMTLVTSLLLAVTITPSVYYFVNKMTKDEIKPTGWIAKWVQIAFVGVLAVIAFYGEALWIGIPIIASVFFMSLVAAKVFYLGDKGLEETKWVRGYEKALVAIVSSKIKMALVLVLAMGVLASSGLLMARGAVKIAFFPQTEPSSLTVGIQLAPGGTLNTNGNQIGLAEEVLMAMPEVAQFNTTIGLDGAVINIELSADDTNGFEKLERIEKALKVLPFESVGIVANAQGGPPVGKPIAVQIIGENLADNMALVEAYVAVLNDIDGVYNIETSIKSGGPELLIDVDLNKAQALGISPMAVASNMRRLTQGEEVSTLKIDGALLPLRLAYEVSLLEDLENAPIMTMAGQELPLGAFASFRESTGISSIQREKGNRIIGIFADVRPGYNATEISESFKAATDSMPLPIGTRIDFGGEVAGISENFGNLLRSMLIAIFLVIIILTVQFGSIKQPLAIMMTVPMAIIGVIYGLYFTGNEFGFYAFMALVSLVGIAVNDAIVLVDYTNNLRKQGHDLVSAVGEAGRTRLNPVLATTLTTIGGILPLSFKNTYYAQFGYALIFGLLVTTLMTLVIVPTLYTLLERKREVTASVTFKRLRFSTAVIVIATLIWGALS